MKIAIEGIVRSVALAGLLLAPPWAAAGGLAGDRWLFSDRVEGVWDVKVTLTNCQTGAPLPFPGAQFDAMSLFAANGTFHDTNATNAALRSEAFGVWERTGLRRYRFAFRFFGFDASGLPIGSTIVRHDVVLSRDGRSYASQGSAEFYDVSGIRMLPDGCSISTATRFE